MLPPIEQISYDDGSGGYHKPCAAAAAFTSALNAPGSTIATRVAESISMPRIRSRLNTMPLFTALLPPERPLPAPRGTTGMPCAEAQRSTASTCSEFDDRTTEAGVHARGSRDQSK